MENGGIDAYNIIEVSGTLCTFFGSVSKLMLRCFDTWVVQWIVCRNPVHIDQSTRALGLVRYAHD